jgi:hypothetical protein
VNAAFLLVTTAWLAGADAAPGAAPAPATVVAAPVAAPVVGSCGCGTSCGCECCEEGWFARFRRRCGGMFNHHNECGCETCNTCAPAPTCCAPAKTWGNCCESGCGHAWGHRWKSSCESSCDCGCEDHSWGHRLRGWFHRGGGCETECGCGGGCASGCCGGGGVVGGPVVMPRAGEAIPPAQTPPKKMPSGKTKSTTSIEPPMGTGAAVSTPAPTTELNAPPIPDVPAAPATDRKDPF